MPENLKSQLTSIARISTHSYPKGSLSKLYRMGNKIFRPNYCDKDGIPFAETELFSHTAEPHKFQQMQEHIKIHSLPDDITDLLIDKSKVHQSRRLDADVFYKLDSVEPQKTPHSCVHAAKFMALEYARSYYQKQTDHFSKWIAKKFEDYSTTSGYDDGVGLELPSKILKTMGLFTQKRPADYGLIQHDGKAWQNDVNDLARYLSYILFCYGPVSLFVQEPKDSYGHGITLTGIIHATDTTPAQIIYADPWEGEMIVEPLTKTSEMLILAAKTFNKNQREFQHVPNNFAASFYRRMQNNKKDMAIEFSDIYIDTEENRISNLQ